MTLDEFYLVNRKTLYINDNCEFLRIDFEENTFLYLNSQQEVVDLDHLLRTEYKLDCQDFTWIFDNDSIIFHSMKEIYIMTFGQKDGHIGPPRKIDISIKH